MVDLNDLKKKYNQLIINNNVTMDSLKKLIDENKIKYNLFERNGCFESLSFTRIEAETFVKLYKKILIRLKMMERNMNVQVFQSANSELDDKLLIHKNYLDNILSDIGNDKLDDDQRRVVVCNDTDLLVIAGAGSGKTTTMLAKIKYLVEKCNVKPEEILLISYTNTIVDELIDKLHHKMKINCDIATFHKLGKNILEKFDTVNVIEEDSDFPQSILSLILEREYFIDKLKLNKFMNFFGNKLFMKKGETHDIFKKTCLEKNISTLMVDNLLDKCIEQSDFKAQITSEYKVEKCMQYLFFDKKGKLRSFYKIIKNIYDKSQATQILLTDVVCDSLSERDLMLLEIAIKFSEEYNKQKNMHKLKDFDDLVIESNLLITTNETDIKKEFKYKYIIIDEFQDISPIRFNLVKQLSSALNSKVVAVGDDWQSIYGFSGSNISLFYDFDKYYTEAKVLKIENTYRNSQQLIDIAGEFVQKNPHQISKNLKSNKKVEYPIISYDIIDEFDDDQQSINDVLEKCIADIIVRRDIKSLKYLKIALLYRYTFETRIFDGNELFIINKKRNELTYIHNKNIKIFLCSVHSSKGLGFDDVILMNVKNESSGFPAQKENENIINLFSKEEEFEFAEERRLFYVACTRTKNRLYILKPQNTSIFYDEIKSKVLENPTDIKSNLKLLSEKFDKTVDTSISTIPSIKNVETNLWEETGGVVPWLKNGISGCTPEVYNSVNSIKNNNSKISNESLEIDYVAIELNRIEIGKKGEDFVMKYERNRLENEGLIEYIEKIDHVSKRDDSFGYDIKSYEVVNGKVSEIFIEVKATQHSIDKPLNITRNELEVSKKLKNQYRLYRVFNLKDDYANLKVFKGSLDELSLIPDRYSVIVK